MNERIKELYKEVVGKDWAYDFDPEVAEKFAELIVQECLEQGTILAKHYIDTHPEQEQAMLLASIADYSNEIKKHFGVEEDDQEDTDSACPLCGEDGGTTCGMPGCQY